MVDRRARVRDGRRCAHALCQGEQFRVRLDFRNRHLRLAVQGLAIFEDDMRNGASIGACADERAVRIIRQEVLIDPADKDRGQGVAVRRDMSPQAFR